LYSDPNIKLVKSNPFITVIIPTKNSELHIKKCLSSILNQTFLDYEIIIRDCISDDDTLKSINSFNDNRIKVYSEIDSGVYDAMNKGITTAKGEWIYFLGSDDELFGNRVFDNVYELLKTSRNMAIYGSVLVVGDAGWAKDGEVYDGHFSIEKIISNNICHQSIFYNKRMFNNSETFNQSYKICADHDLNIRLATKFRFHHIDLIIAKFRGGGLSSQTDANFISDFDNIVIKHHPYRVHKFNLLNIKIQKEAHQQLMNGRFLKSLYLYSVLIYKKTIFKMFLKAKK